MIVGHRADRRAATPIRRCVDFVEAFARVRLGREIVRTHDTPAFAGNRVGFKVLNEVAQLAEQIGPLLVGSHRRPVHRPRA